jgi:hypothetical protein
MKLLLQGGNGFRAEQWQGFAMIAVAFHRTESLAGKWHALVRSVFNEEFNGTARTIGKDKKSLRKIQSCSKTGSGRC